jgi:hypothetical protein
MAAPITPESAAPEGAEVLDLVRARRARTTTYRALLDDLASWPVAFRRRVGESLRRYDDSPEWISKRFEIGRRLGDGDDQHLENGCRCGCQGFNGEFVHYLKLLRTTAGEVLDARALAVDTLDAKAVLRERREELDERKRDLLKLLWLHGQRRIDRARLREHATEHVRAELADIQRRIGARAAHQSATAEVRARAVHLEALLADPHELAREWTGCLRTQGR